MSESMKVSHELWQLMIRTFHLMRRAAQKELNEYNITTRSSAVMQTIIRIGEGATATRIARQLVIEKNSMSEQLARMEKSGLIKRVKSPKNKNFVHIELTEKGHELNSKAQRRNTIDEIMSVISPEEQRILWSIMAKIREQSLKSLGKDNTDLFPPSDPDELDI